MQNKIKSKKTDVKVNRKRKQKEKFKAIQTKRKIRTMQKKGEW